MSTTLKQLKSNLQPEYLYNWKLIKEKEISQKHQAETHLDLISRINNKTTKSLCQNIDLIVPSKERTQSQQIQLEQFLNIIGTPLHTETRRRHHHQEQQEVEFQTTHPRQFERNDDKRQFRIQEFIKTESSYVETLKTLVKYVVNPLKHNMQQKNGVLNTFKCHKIFLNIHQILAVNQKFLTDLQSNPDFGHVCQEHMPQFECYRKYLLEQSEAQKLHAKEFKMNQAYKRFLTKVRDQSEFKRKRLQDILVEPVQRISRYSMMLREILQLTPEDHSDFRGLKLACEKASEIATMADDDPTKTATMFLNLYQAIKDSPCSLINQKRSFLAHLDATELDCATNKPKRSVSLFLFTDKVLVATRLDTKEIDLEELLMTPVFSTTSKHEKAGALLKFKGWADLESIELFEGLTNSSFILTATNVQEIKRDEISKITSFETYFYKGPRLFSIDKNQKLNDFKSLYQKARALVKQYEPQDLTYYRVWKGVPTFCNIYNPDSYVSAKYKNDTALIYIDDETIDTETLFPRSSYLFNPWIIGLIQPEHMKGFRFNLCTRLNFSRHSLIKSTELTLDFESIFWNNLLVLDQSLKRSVEFAAHSTLKIQQAISSHHPTPTRSMVRTSTPITIGKLFQNDPSNKIISTIIPKRVPVVHHHTWPPNDNTNTSSSLWTSTLDENTVEIIDHGVQDKCTIEHPKPISTPRTISSIGSDSSTRSSGSMIEDDGNDEDEEEEEEIDYLTIGTLSNSEQQQPKENTPETLFADEMQEQWKALITKYDLAK